MNHPPTLAVAFAAAIEYPLGSSKFRPFWEIRGPLMRLFRHYDEIPAEYRGAVIALGNFDGVHLGHRAVIGAAQALANAAGVPAAAMSFEPHPRQVFMAHLPPFRLSPLRVKVRWLEAIGLDYAWIQHFDPAFAATTPQQFVETVLVDGLGVSHVVVGEDYSFGKGRSGTLDTLRHLCGSRGVMVSSVRAVRGEDGQVLSSTRVREALTAGRPDDAAAILGRPFEIEGRVEHGDKLGRTIGFPTANVSLGEFIRPARGVYAVWAGADHGAETLWWPGVANLGRRPTVGGQEDRLEVHLFDFDQDLYHQHLRVQLIAFLRPEQSFPGLEALKAQIAADAAQARIILAGRPAEK